MQASLDAAAPAAGSVATAAGSSYRSFTSDAVGNRASLTDDDPAKSTLDVRTASGYGRTATAWRSVRMPRPAVACEGDRADGITGKQPEQGWSQGLRTGAPSPA